MKSMKFMQMWLSLDVSLYMSACIVEYRHRQAGNHKEKKSIIISQYDKNRKKKK